MDAIMKVKERTKNHRQFSSLANYKLLSILFVFAFLSILAFLSWLFVPLGSHQFSPNKQDKSY